MSQITDVPHPYTIAINEDGDRETEWTHPANCPDGDQCDIERRVAHSGRQYMAELGEGLPNGTYVLARFWFHGLILTDAVGREALPEEQEAA